MQKYILLFFILLNTNILICQKAEYGIGIGSGGYFFRHQNERIFDNDVLKPTWRVSGGILGYANFYSKYNFQLRSNIHLTYKPISFSASFQDLNGVFITHSMTFNIFSADLSLLGLYKIDLKKSHILPFMGIFYSMNKFLDVTFEEQRNSFWTRLSNTVSSGNPVYATNLEITKESKANNVGINTGCFWHFDNSRFEPFVMAYLSPINFFSENFEYKSLQTKYYLQGHYNYFILGINYKLSKKRILEYLKF